MYQAYRKYCKYNSIPQYKMITFGKLLKKRYLIVENSGERKTIWKYDKLIQWVVKGQPKILSYKSEEIKERERWTV